VPNVVETSQIKDRPSEEIDEELAWDFDEETM
jgi:hypothetical protein